jgi:hypothetical protein
MVEDHVFPEADGLMVSGPCHHRLPAYYSISHSSFHQGGKAAATQAYDL